MGTVSAIHAVPFPLWVPPPQPALTGGRAVSPRTTRRNRPTGSGGGLRSLLPASAAVPEPPAQLPAPHGPPTAVRAPPARRLLSLRPVPRAHPPAPRAHPPAAGPLASQPSPWHAPRQERVGVGAARRDGRAPARVGREAGRRGREEGGPLILDSAPRSRPLRRTRPLIALGRGGGEEGGVGPPRSDAGLPRPRLGIEVPAVRAHPLRPRARFFRRRGLPGRSPSCLAPRRVGPGSVSLSPQLSGRHSRPAYRVAGRFASKPASSLRAPLLPPRGYRRPARHDGDLVQTCLMDEGVENCGFHSRRPSPCDGDPHAPRDQEPSSQQLGRPPPSSRGSPHLTGAGALTTLHPLGTIVSTKNR